MECLKTSFIRKLGPAHDYTLPSIQPSDKLWMRPTRLACSLQCSSSSRECQTYFSMIYPVRSFFYGHKSRAVAEPDVSDSNEIVPEDDASEETLSQKLSSDQLKALLLDTERTKILKKLSEANQYNRFLKRQLLPEGTALAKYMNELAVLELELVALVGLAKEIADSEVRLVSRQINGKSIESHLLARLISVHKKVKEQIEDSDYLEFQEVTLFWCGMAESVQVMGSFDGWTQGEDMSSEYIGDHARFSATMKLRPGRYEIKFLVDGEWQLSSELPTVGEGTMLNNLLVVKPAN